MPSPHSERVPGSNTLGFWGFSVWSAFSSIGVLRFPHASPEVCWFLLCVSQPPTLWDNLFSVGWEMNIWTTPPYHTMGFKNALRSLALLLPRTTCPWLSTSLQNGWRQPDNQTKPQFIKQRVPATEIGQEERRKGSNQVRPVQDQVCWSTQWGGNRRCKGEAINNPKPLGFYAN